MKLKKIIIALNLFLITFSVSAYDAIGHRIIADIAYQHLSKKAKKQCDKLLGQKGLVYEAPWADEVKSDKSYDYSYDWHFQNLKDSMTTDDLKALLENPTSEGEHLFYAIKTMTERLKSNQSDAEALKFLVHLVGDLHQPMHLGRSDDKGGNRVEMIGLERKLMFMLFGTVKLRQANSCLIRNLVPIFKINSGRRKILLKTVAFYSRWKRFMRFGIQFMLMI
jgi:hypothetical protein